MAQVINTNVSAMFGAQALYKSNNALQTAMARLSSGLRINTAMDDATGLVTASTYEGDMRGARQAARNASDGISTAQTNDGYLGQISENLQRLRELAVQGAGTASGAETTALLLENTRVLAFVTSAAAVVVNKDGGTLTGAGTKPTMGGLATIAGIEADLTAVNASRAQYGGDMSRFTSAVAVLQIEEVNIAAAYSRVMDTDYAVETTNMTRNMILQQAGTAMLSQANQVPNNVLGLLR
ncbi:MAG: flagellin [Sulfuricellaceae bacterium]|nr:flagellin [Sulfuricellaceae bacterium]